MATRLLAEDPLELDDAPGCGRYAWHAGTDALDWSPGMLALFGVNRVPDIAGFTALIHRDDRDAVQATIASMMNGGQHYRQRFRIVRPDGSVRTVLDSGRIERDAGGQVTGIVGFTIDVTETLPQAPPQPAVPPAAPPGEPAAAMPANNGPWLHQIVEQAPGTFAMLDADMRYLFASTRYCSDFGLPAAALAGSRHDDLLPGTGDMLRRLHGRAMAGETASAEEQWQLAGRDAPDWLRWTMSPWRLVDGSIAATILTVEVITTRMRTRQALAESQARLADALRAGGLGIHDFDPRSGRVVWDATSRALWGIPDDEEITYQSFLAGVDPADVAALEQTLAAAFDPANHGIYEAVYRVRHRSTGEVRWVRADGKVTFENGVATRLVGTMADITEQRAVAERVQVLLAEVSHRSKNLLSVVQAIARQTGHGDPATFLERFDRRISALAASQDLLVQNEWRGVDLASLAQAQLEHFRDIIGSRIHIRGPDVQLTAAAAQSLGMAFHELSTNAAKHGALSCATGHIDIGWAMSSSDAGFMLTWRERGGPPVQPPQRKGFGSLVIGRLTEAGVQGRVRIDYAGDGLVWQVECAPACIACAAA